MNLQMTMHKGMFIVRKNSPYILLGLGIVTLVGAVAESIHATTKLGYVLDDHDNRMAGLDLSYEEETNDIESSEDMAAVEKQYKKDVRKVYLATAWDITKLYAPTAALTVLSLTSFCGSFSILNKRYMGVSAALAATTKAFESYRERVRAEEDGEIKDFAYLHGLDIIDAEHTIEDGNGKKKKIKEKVLVGTPKKTLFSYRWQKYDSRTCKGSTQWDNCASYSIPYIENVIRINQRRLDIGQEVWLNNLLEELGFEEHAEDNKGDMDGSERIAGWKPGDIITCGLEEVGASKILCQDTLDFLYGDSPDVTLIFNARPNMFSDVYTDVPELSDPDTITVEAKEVTE